jgi:hypothetical protein
LGACALLAGFGGVESESLSLFNPLITTVLAMVQRQEAVYLDGKLVDVIHFSGDSNQAEEIRDP